jgi:four helix bundle protein
VNQQQLVLKITMTVGKEEQIMNKIEKFEDLIAWQKARELTKEIYGISRRGAFAKDYGLSGQIQRASVSIMSNVAEGFERGGRSEFHQFLSVAKASCAEVRSLLYVALDIEFIDKTKFRKIMDKAEEVGRIVGGLRASVEKQKKTKTDQ